MYLVFASLQVTAGGLGDRYGRRHFFIIGIACFSLTPGLAIFIESTSGLIAENWPWQWSFLTNVPIDIGAIALTTLAVRKSWDPSGDTAIDCPGTITVSLLIDGLIEAGEAGWTTGVVSFLISGLAFTGTM